MTTSICPKSGGHRCQVFFFIFSRHFKKELEYVTEGFTDLQWA